MNQNHLTHVSLFTGIGGLEYEEPTPQELTAWVEGFVTGIVISFLLAFALALFFMSYAVDVNSSSEWAQILANTSNLALTGVQV